MRNPRLKPGIWQNVLLIQKNTQTQKCGHSDDSTVQTKESSLKMLSSTQKNNKKSDFLCLHQL